jgi:putative acetyltransferase
MKVIEVENRTNGLLDHLVAVWEGAVRATHLFLSEAEIARIKTYVPQALRAVPHLVIAQEEDPAPLAFMGIADGRLEMLFVSQMERGRGIGRRLLQYGIAHYGIQEVAVNEQNPLARGFYEHMGFQVYRRTEEDEQGDPYPLLYMRLEG